MSERTLTHIRAFSFRGMASALSLLSFQLLNVNAPRNGPCGVAHAWPGPRRTRRAPPATAVSALARSQTRRAGSLTSRWREGRQGLRREQHRGARTASGLPVQAQLGLGWDSDSGWPRLTRTNEQRTREVDLALRCRGRATVVFVGCFGLLFFLVQFGA